MYIHELPEWPNFTWDKKQVAETLAETKFHQGHLLGEMKRLGFSLREQANLQILTREVIKTSEIEGEHLDKSQVRSSVARHLGIDIGGFLPANRHVDGLVEVLLDATRQYSQPLTKERLFAWHVALFPSSRSGLMLVNRGMWRPDSGYPMQVVSGYHGREKVHFEAPSAARVSQEMQKFLKWFNQSQSMDLIIKAAIAHFWFVTIHPFDDGNGRIARAIADMVLAHSEEQPDRFYSMSSQIRHERKKYYDILERTQKGNLDITKWLVWFLQCLERAIQYSNAVLATILNKAKFWQQHAEQQFNERQIFMLNTLFDGFKGKLTSSKWGKMTKCSQDTASRDIKDLMDKGVLVKSPESGRSTNYLLRDFPINCVE